MIHLFLSLSILAAPCVQTLPLKAGEGAPCSGLLWSPEQTKKALKCARVDLPRCESELDLNRALLNAQLAKPPAPPSDPPSKKFWWALGGIAVGFIGGVAVTVTL